jgi:hypothetical protein
MWAYKRHNISYVILAFGIFSLMLLGPLGELRGEAALKANEVLTAGDHVPEGNLTTEIPLESWKSEILENQVFGDTSLKPYSRQGLIKKPQPNSLLHLKSPGKLPGIEFGIEMHSLQAFQSVVPLESLPRGLDHKPEQPLLLPPSINAPDYNGGFLRFTW